ncbi:MAG: tetratricopeptide repeat protein, partial [Gemmatimonadota bacterium]
ERDWRRDLDVIPLLERAIAIDTTFAAAYWALGSILHADFIDWSRQTALTQKAYEHRDRLNDYQRFIVEESYMFDSLANWADTTRPQPDECDIEEPLLHLAEAYLRRHPEDPRPLGALGNHQWRTGHLEEALASYRRLTEMDPSVYSGWNLLLYGQLTVGDIKGARGTLHDWRKTLPELGAREFDFDEASVAAYQGNYARADSVFESVVASYKDDRHVQVNAAKLDAVLGRMNEAWQHYEYAIRRVGRAGYPAGALLWVTHEALIRLVAMEDSAGAVADVKAALAALPDTLNLADTWTDVGLVYALAGDPVRAQAELDSLTRHGRGNWSSSRGVLGAAIALAKGKPEEALELLAATQIPCTTFNNSADFRLGPRLRRVLAGRADEALHRPDAAIAMYEAYLTDPPNTYPANLDAVFLFDTLERLGTLHEARGDSAEAAIYYARAADLWKDADPELQPRVRLLRERAPALSPGAVDTLRHEGR